MAYNRNDDDVRRLAEVIYTSRLTVAKVPTTKAALDKFVDAEVFLAFQAAENFSQLAEVWLDEMGEEEPE